MSDFNYCTAEIGQRGGRITVTNANHPRLHETAVMYHRILTEYKDMDGARIFLNNCPGVDRINLIVYDYDILHPLDLATLCKERNLICV